MLSTIQEEGEFKFVTYGEAGKTLLLLHGLFGALSNFNSIIEHFSSNYRVVVPLLPIYDLPLREVNIANLVTYVEKFVAYQGYESVILLGNSLGGHVALLYAFSNQERVAAMVLTGSSGLFENAFGDTFPKRKNYEFMRQKTAMTFYDPKFATKELVDEVFEIVNNRLKAIRVVSVAKSAMRHNVAEMLPDIKVPTLLIWGKQDNITPAFVAEDFKKLLPNAQLHFIDLCGHAPMMEHPAKFNELLQRFLETLLTTD